MLRNTKFVLLFVNIVVIMSFSVGWMASMSIALRNDYFKPEIAANISAASQSGNITIILFTTLASLLALNFVVYQNMCKLKSNA